MARDDPDFDSIRDLPALRELLSREDGRSPSSGREDVGVRECARMSPEPESAPPHFARAAVAAAALTMSQMPRPSP